MNLVRDKMKAMGNPLPIPFLTPLNLTSPLSYFPNQINSSLPTQPHPNFYDGRDFICLIYLYFNKSNESV